MWNTIDYKGIFNVSMVSDDEFYLSFRDNVIGPDTDPDDLTNKSHRVSFLMPHYHMIPSTNKDFFWNMTRAFPTSPLYAYLALGVIGTNISRYSAVRRLRGDASNVERVGVSIKYLHRVVMARVLLLISFRRLALIFTTNDVHVLRSMLQLRKKHVWAQMQFHWSN